MLLQPPAKKKTLDFGIFQRQKSLRLFAVSGFHLWTENLPANQCLAHCCVTVTDPLGSLNNLYGMRRATVDTPAAPKHACVCLYSSQPADNAHSVLAQTISSGSRHSLLRRQTSCGLIQNESGVEALSNSGGAVQCGRGLSVCSLQTCDRKSQGFQPFAYLRSGATLPCC